MARSLLINWNLKEFAKCATLSSSSGYTGELADVCLWKGSPFPDARYVWKILCMPLFRLGIARKKADRFFMTLWFLLWSPIRIFHILYLCEISSSVSFISRAHTSIDSRSFVVNKMRLWRRCLEVCLHFPHRYWGAFLCGDLIPLYFNFICEDIFLSKTFLSALSSAANSLLALSLAQSPLSLFSRFILCIYKTFIFGGIFQRMSSSLYF